MSSKQDRTQSRTPADTERKFLLNLQKSFAEILGVATDARTKAENTESEIARLEVKISETADGIILSVADVYATNESVASAIEVMRDNILLSVSETYETQDNAKTKRAEIQTKVDENSAYITSQATLIAENKSSIASTNTKVNENSASIKQQTATITEHTTNIATLTAKTNEQGASIALVVENDEVKGSVIVEAINGQSSAKISADKLDIEGKTLNIKVESTNIEGEISAEQINAEGLDIPRGNIGGWTLEEMSVPIGWADENNGIVATRTEKALYSGAVEETKGDGIFYVNETWLTPSGVSISSRYYVDGGGDSPPVITYKTWRQILLGE